MSLRFVGMILLTFAIATAGAEPPATQPATQPSTQPATQPAASRIKQLAEEVRRIAQLQPQRKEQQERHEADERSAQLAAELKQSDEQGASPATQPATQPSAKIAAAPATQPARQTNQKTATAPATQPATQPALASKATPTTQPTTQPLAKKFPTPAELIEKLKREREREEALTKVAYFNLDDAILEKPADFSFFGGEPGTTLRSLLDRLHKARHDKGVRAVLVTIGAGSGMNLAQAQEVRDALIELRRGGKKTFVYADSYDTIGYTVASGATDVCLLEGGEIMVPGIGIETMFYKGTMDKIGVFADYVQIGEFKGADEAYTRTAASDELRGELTKLIDSIYDQIVDGISLSRSMSTSAVREMIDDTMLTAAVAKERGFVDHLVDQDGLRALLKDELNNDISLVHGYGKPKRDSIDFSNPWAIFAAMAKKPETSDKPAIALIYAEGVIVDGKGEPGLLGGGAVGSDSMREAIRMAVRDANVKAIVVRIDSPGGSALASEVIWQALRRAAAEKPVIISIGSMAASGGYYLASAGDYIFADPSAIVGSIGVVGGKFVFKDLFDKIGLTTESFNKGRNADLFSSTQKFSERQKRLIRTWMQQTYDRFTQRVMTTRFSKIKDIDQVARGRIFIAKQARELGMIDELGGLQSALVYAANQASLKKDEYEVRVLPPPKTIADLFAGGSDETALPLRPTVTVSPDSALHALAPAQRKMLAQQFQAMQLLQQRPVMLMSPYVLSVK